MPNTQQVLDKFLDFGEVQYMVDTSYRTQAQGWSRADGTGPLDLSIGASGRRSQAPYVFRTGDFGSTSAAMQAANDAMVDGRGDALVFTPGSYTPATALTVTKADARWLGPKVADPRLARATITAGVASVLGLSAAADRMEFGFLRIVPLTATAVLALTAGCDKLYMHDVHYDTRGIATSTSTLLMTAAAAADHKFQRIVINTDAAQGAPFTYTGTATCISFNDITFWHGNGTTLAIALADFQGAATGVEVEMIRGNLTGLASSAVTNLIKFSESGGDIQTIGLRNVRTSIGFCAASALVSLTSAEAAEVGIANSYLDVVSGGAGGAGTAFTA